MEIRQMTQQAIELLKQMIEIPSISRDEKNVADMLERYMIEMCHLEVNRDGNNLWSVDPMYDADRKTLLLNAHIDTVKPVAAWTRNPNEAKIEEGRLYGLGSNDDGASVVSLLMTFCHLIQNAEDRNYNIIFLASAEEEVSGKNGIEHVLPLLPHVDVALVGEPTCMQPCIAEKGLMVLDITEHGVAGHAARNEGENALYHAVDDIQWIRTYQFPLQTDLLGPVKMTATIINAGTQHNVIPDQCTFTVDVRSNEMYTNQQIYDIITENVRGEVKARSFRLSSSRIDVSHPLVQAAIDLGRTPFGSPTLSDQALMRFPSMKMGPGDSRRSHTADEFVCLDEIEEAIRLYLTMLKSLVL